MHVFVTGASGFVGSAVVRELVSAGHRVLGLARSDEGARAVVAAGAEVHRGDLDDLAGLAAAASKVDAVVHTAFNHDFSRYVESCAHDRRVVLALGSALASRAQKLVVTSALGVLAEGRDATEDTMPATGNAAHPRATSEEATEALAAEGRNVAVVRLPPSTHGAGDPHFAATLVAIARERGVSAYPEEGLNLWPAVHRSDAARLYRLVLEDAGATGRFHAVAEEGVVFRDIARVIGESLGVPTVSKTTAELGAHFGWFSRFVGIDVRASSAITRARTGWRPVERGLLADLVDGGYFAPKGNATR